VPYDTLAQLPPAVQRLPIAAQRIFKAAFDNGYDKNDESASFKRAWGAVENAGYQKNAKTGKWTKR
jgi:cation transport regulator ChaB